MRIAGSTDPASAATTGASTAIGGELGPSQESGAANVDGPSFASALEEQIADARHLQAVATEKAESFARGTNDDLHGTMISMKEAEISLKLVGTVRNKLLDAFHELWRINL